jgi:hypothetical protein
MFVPPSRIACINSNTQQYQEMRVASYKAEKTSRYSNRFSIGRKPSLVSTEQCIKTMFDSNLSIQKAFYCPPLPPQAHYERSKGQNNTGYGLLLESFVQDCVFQMGCGRVSEGTLTACNKGTVCAWNAELLGCINL